MIERLRSKKMWLYCTAIVIFVIVIGLYFYSGNNMSQNQKKAPATQDASPIMAMGDTIVLDEKARQLIGLKTETVSSQTLEKDIRATGEIGINDRGKTYLTSRIEGRIERTTIGSDGEYVSAGQAIATAYSPTYIAAQEEYLLALDNLEKFKNSDPNIIKINQSLKEAARQKLRLLNIPQDEISHLEHTRKANQEMTIYAQFGGAILEKQLFPGQNIMPGDRLLGLANLSTVWVSANIYESDIASLNIGQSAIIKLNAYPDDAFGGQVVFVSPTMDPTTRTVKVRIEVGNSSGKLKPGMFADVIFRTALGESLVIPESSILDTGSQKFVYVAQDANTFKRREIIVGQSANGSVQVASGLSLGEEVVTSAAFLIDSQTKLGSFGNHSGHGGSKSNNNSPIPSPSNVNTPSNSVEKRPASEHSGH